MTPSGLREWWRHHCSLVCIHHSEYDQCFEEAMPILLRMKATVEELDEASIWFWSEPEQMERKWGTHISIIRQHILLARRKRRDKEEPPKCEWTAEMSAKARAMASGIIGSIGMEESA